MSGYSSTTKSVGVRLQNEIVEALDNLAARKGIERTELIRRWIAQAYAAEVRQLEESGESTAG